jgi:hypothetical protein
MCLMRHGPSHGRHAIKAPPTLPPPPQRRSSIRREGPLLVWDFSKLSRNARASIPHDRARPTDCGRGRASGYSSNSSALAMIQSNASCSVEKPVISRSGSLGYLMTTCQPVPNLSGYGCMTGCSLKSAMEAEYNLNLRQRLGSLFKRGVRGADLLRDQLEDMRRDRDAWRDETERLASAQ